MMVHPRALDYTQSFLSGVIPDEAELTAGQRVEPGRSYGFFTDTTLCIGCKACEVACKEWNALPADDLGLRGTSTTIPATSRRRPGGIFILSSTSPRMASVRRQCRPSRATG
jgi:Fe-S-cluster-containing dehydrogenase component